MTSSTRMTISAASTAELTMAYLSLNDSAIPSAWTSAATPRSMSRPMWCSPRAWCALSVPTSSAASSPALSAMIPGSARNARAKESIASAILPCSAAAASSTALAIASSAHPAPRTMRDSTAAVCDSTHNASCSDRSASSSSCEFAPRSTTVHAAPAEHPENRSTVCSPIITSSTFSHFPSSTLPGSSNVDTIDVPVTSANRSTPSKSACSIAMMPLLEKNCSGRL
mmetsp:Transcript_13390/g.29045  ORF Transcript_13390/g.29045 Transcript_13390/m.29045 type:complete len:226 (+) Transcript_13390:111-788(+)